MFTKEDTKIVKGIAIILMLYHHLFRFPERIIGNTYVSFFASNNTLAYYLGDFGKLCVAIFLFLGGYGLYHSSKKQEENAFSKSRILQLYKPFWQVFFICIPITIFINPDFFHSTQTFLWNLSGLHITYNAEWWFLTPYLILIIFFPLLKKIIDRISKNFYLDLFLLGLFQVLIVTILPNLLAKTIFNQFRTTIFYYNLNLTIPLLTTFLMGMVFAKYDVLSDLKKRYTTNYLYVIVSGIILAMLFYMRYQLGWNYDLYFAPISIICFLILLSPKIFYRPRKILQKIGEESTYIWLIHSFYCYFWMQDIIYLPKYSLLICCNLLIISYLTAKVFRYFYYFLEKLFLKIIPYCEYK